MGLNTGPFIKVACFCDNAIEGKDGVFTLVRLVDVITHTAQGPVVSDEMPPVQYPLKLVIMIAPGRARGRHTLKIEPESPMGLRALEHTFSISIHFEEGRTANLIIDFNYVFEIEGMYLFHVLLDDDHLTTMPVTIRYNRIMSGS